MVIVSFELKTMILCIFLVAVFFFFFFFLKAYELGGGRVRTN